MISGRSISQVMHDFFVSKTTFVFAISADRFIFIEMSTVVNWL